MAVQRDIFQALADPTRRAIIDLVSCSPLNLNAIADNFTISRPAVSQHVKILSDCGLIVVTQIGRERYCRAELKKLREVSDWVDQYRQMWKGRFAALENHLESVHHKKQKNESNNRSRRK